MAVTAFVPVRGGSKSIPLKNIKDFCGKPLVYWLVNALNQATVVDHVVVATDSDEIEKTVTGICHA
jgi:CMP-N-acetylneuraminic acid synthetase